MLVRYYHGSLHKFENFSLEKSDSLCDFGNSLYFTNQIKDALNYADPEFIENKHLDCGYKTEKGYLYEVDLEVNNTLFVDFETKLDLFSFKVGDVSDSMFYGKLITSFKHLLEIEDIDFDEEELFDLFESYRDDAMNLNLMNLKEDFCGLDAYTYEGKQAGNELVKLFIAHLGYDSILDETVYWRFGEGSKLNKTIKNMDENTKHLIIFDSNKILRFKEI